MKEKEISVFFGPNIKLLRTRRKKSQDEVASAIGIKRTSLSGYELGSSEPNFETLIRFSNYFKVSVNKLLQLDLSTVRESVLAELEKGYDMDITGTHLRILATTVDNENNENIELVPIAAKAGYTDGYADPAFIKVLPTFQLPFLSRQRKYRTFPISGDSMPPVSDGSWVTGEYLQNWKMLKNGFPYIIITKDDGIVFKLVYNHVEENGNLLLCSTNPEYEPYEVPISEVLEIWKFVNYMSNELPEPNIAKDNLAQSVLKLQQEIAQLKLKFKED